MARLLSRAKIVQRIACGAAMMGALVAADWMTILSGYDQRLADVSYRLARSAGPLCDRQGPLTGLFLQDLSQFDRGDRTDARDTLGLGQWPEVSAVADQSPAARSIRVGDAIVAVDGRSPPPEVSRRAATSARVDSTLDMIDAALTSGNVTLTIHRDGQDRAVRLVPESGCRTRFQTATSGEIDAGADGEHVAVDAGAIAFAQGDDELAAIVAHELAHNILRHADRLAAAHVRSTRSTRGAQLTLQTEVEADRLSVYLMSRAGYDPHSAITFWRRIETDRLGKPQQRAHLSPEARAALIGREIDRLERMRNAREEPRPDFLQEPLPPLR